MTKNKLKTINVITLIISLICIIIFLVLSNNYKDNILLWIFFPLMVISFLIAIREYFKEIKEDDLYLTKENIFEILKLL